MIIIVIYLIGSLIIMVLSKIMHTYKDACCLSTMAFCIFLIFFVLYGIGIIFFTLFINFIVYLLICLNADESSDKKENEKARERCENNY